MRLDIKLKSVKLENFRLFENLEMDFHPQLTVLIGENGAGKTALIEGIIMLMSAIPKELSKHFKIVKPISKKYSENDIRAETHSFHNSIHFNYHENGSIHELKWSANGERNGRTIPQFGNLHSLHPLIEDFKFPPYSGKDSIPILVYYPCEKTDDSKYEGKSQKDEYREDKMVNAFDNTLNGKSFDFPRFFEWYKWQEDKEVRGQGTKTLQIARHAILAMLNDEGEDKFIGIRVDVSSFGNYRLKLKKGDAELEVSQLSSGEKSLFALVSDIARRLSIANPASKDPLREGSGIVLIDEIDLHLHPRWQRKIVNKLTEIFPNIQFIVTTHSPLILGSVRSENIRLLDEGEVFSVPETLGQSVGMIVKQIMGVEESLFEDDMRHIFRLLAKNKIGEAKAEIAAIENQSPAEIPALMEAKAVLKRKEILSQ